MSSKHLIIWRYWPAHMSLIMKTLDIGNAQRHINFLVWVGKAYERECKLVGWTEETPGGFGTWYIIHRVSDLPEVRGRIIESQEESYRYHRKVIEPLWVQYEDYLALANLNNVGVACEF